MADLPASTRLGHSLAKILGIQVDYRQENREDRSISSSETFVDVEPTAKEWLSKFKPTKSGATAYITSLFPFLQWIFHYNLQWLTGDLIAGITVGFVAVPQGMAYALLANLTAEYGLYTSFVGFVLYWAFATSKDITIGTVAVMSTIVGNIVLRVQEIDPDIPAEQIARGLSVICGAVLLFIGLIRAGWIVEFIPLVAITSFMTGAAISIAVGQVPALLGIRGINTREAAYMVLINTLKALPQARLDAAMGLSALVMLYDVKYFCTFMQKKQPNQRKTWFFISTLRMSFVILLYIFISWLANRHINGDASQAKFRILGTVPRGFQHAGAPVINTRLIRLFSSDLPASLIVLVIEHIAISKSFGRINNYTIDPSQELVALGFTNLIGPFLGGYPATGSFSRTAIKSKAGVRTPLAGVFTALIVLLALYALTSVFFYIPMSSLAGLIIHAVGDLITHPNVVYRFWEVSPLEVVIFFAGVLLTIFTNIENGIYLTIASSAALLLFRVAKAKGNFLGRVRIHYISREELLREAERKAYQPDEKSADTVREAFLPLEHQDGSNPDIEIETPYPGIFIYRFSEGFTYPNQAHYLDNLTTQVLKATRRTQLGNYAKLGDRPWNDPGPRRGEQINMDDQRPILRAIVLDFSSVNHVDVTSIQGLIDIRNQLDRHAAPELVEWHIAHINSRWTKRALAAAGFGYPTEDFINQAGQWKPVYGVAETFGYKVGGDSSSSDLSDRQLENRKTGRFHDDIEHASPPSPTADDCGKSVHDQVNDHFQTQGKLSSVHGLNRPFFHVDLSSAVHAAINNAERKIPSGTRFSVAGERILPEQGRIIAPENNIKTA